MTIVILNLALDLCSLIIIMITLYGVFLDARENTMKNKLFKLIVAVNLLCILIDLSSFYFIFTNPGGTGWYVSSLIAAIPPFIWVALVMFYLLSIIREHKLISWRIGWIFAAIDAIAVIIGVVFGIEGIAFSWKDNHFEPGFMGPIVFGFNVVFLLFYGTTIFWNRRQLGFYNSIALFMYLVIPMTGLCIDATFVGTYSLLFCMTASVLLCFMMIQHRELINANHAKTVFLNNMSHDIRTPMNAIIGYTELIERDLNKKEAVAGYVKKVKMSGDYLLNLINNVLDMARIDSGQTELEEKCYDLSKIEHSFLPLFEQSLQSKNLKLDVRTDITNRYVMVDQMKLQQIMVNLISNAVKYTNDGGHIEVVVREQPDSQITGHYLFIVKDNGIGMSPAFAEHIFEQFSRERNSTESKVIGSGLGMSIVKKLVDLMGGKIYVDSQQGRGTIFSVDLELKIVKNAPTVVANSYTRSTESNIKADGRHILVAEDNDLNAEIVTLMLEREGLVVERASDGEQCVRMLRNAPDNHFALILMDIQMPTLNGLEAARKIRAQIDSRKSAIPIIAVTANAFEEDRRQALASGMNDYISKPIDSELLKKKLAKYIY